MKKTFIIAELSGNHNNDFEYTKETILAMKEAGADAVKLQTYTADSLTLNVNNEEFGPRKEGLWKGKKPYDVFSEGALPYEWHKDLFEYARGLGLECFSSPFDEEAVDFLESLGNPIYKVASFEIQHTPLIEKIAATGKPVIISTGIATLADIEIALGYFTDKSKVTLLKCTSAYPTPYSEVNLNAMLTLKETFGVNVGLSDHTLGTAVPVAAAALGASVIEKHFILDRSKGGVDADFSMSPDEFKEMVDSVRIVEQALGSREFILSEGSKKSRLRGRSIYVSKDVKKGELITRENIRVVRPASGLAPIHFKDVLGRKFARSLVAGSPLQIDLLD
ncbi:pseudaminic acid synthase [Vibrio navarrensis]|uniref:pseudaminic acid synthase n=1 Tax=Vibrio navarrensis TaxID=29495 RepID=UPI00186A0017|nr:pseudaminic acid synthase [Vibrio navarrensis]MBE4575066.1 pseudaminic acid synthase [Vibrio navarrensis]MBE4590028.1 pseudaminic acid synthase [Vibrio navarrensis]